MGRKRILIEVDPEMEKLFKFLDGLNKADKDKVFRAMSLKSKLTYDLPQEYRRTHREYRELLSRNQDLFQRQKLMTQ